MPVIKGHMDQNIMLILPKTLTNVKYAREGNETVRNIERLSSFLHYTVKEHN